MTKINNYKIFTNFLSIMAFLLIIMAFPVCAAVPSDAKSSVVCVIGIGSAEVGWGSGFAIGEVGKPVEYIVTNNHVVRGDLGNTTATVAFDLASNDMVTANVYFYDKKQDIAILKLPQPTYKRKAMVLCPMKYVDMDDSFAALGYPSNQFAEWPKYNMDDITITKGGIKKSDRLDGQDVYILDLKITYGNSGGPLVNSNGEVVGINSFGLIEDNYAIAIDELLKVIDTDRIPVTVHGYMNWLIVAGCIGLFVIILIVVILIVSKKKKQSSTAEDYIPTPSVNYNPTNQAHTQPVVQPVSQPVSQVQRNNVPAARIVAIGGTLNGKRYSVSGHVKIGRDSSRCAIAFPVNTQGVSAVHCEIGYDGSACYIKDLNSRYGTFTMDGRKLAPNAPVILKSGDKFYLASTENTFEVRF